MPKPAGHSPRLHHGTLREIAIVMPGPPFEMKHMFEHHAKPFLQARSEHVLLSHYVRVLGMGESTIAAALEDLIKNQTNPTIATYITNSDEKVRITAKCKKGRRCRSHHTPGGRGGTAPAGTRRLRSGGAGDFRRCFPNAQTGEQDARRGGELHGGMAHVHAGAQCEARRRF